MLAVPGFRLALGLLESVVDGDWESGMRLFGQAVHGLRHAVQEECLCVLLAAMAVRGRDQLLGFGHGERCEEIGKTGLSERRSQT